MSSISSEIHNSSCSRYSMGQIQLQPGCDHRSQENRFFINLHVISQSKFIPSNLLAVRAYTSAKWASALGPYREATSAWPGRARWSVSSHCPGRCHRSNSRLDRRLSLSTCGSLSTVSALDSRIQSFDEISPESAGNPIGATRSAMATRGGQVPIQ